MGTKTRARKMEEISRRGIGRGALRKLAKKAGVYRMGGDVLEQARELTITFMRKIINNAITYAEYSNRVTVMTIDVLHSLKLNGGTLYGYGV